MAEPWKPLDPNDDDALIDASLAVARGYRMMPKAVFETIVGKDFYVPSLNFRSVFLQNSKEMFGLSRIAKHVNDMLVDGKFEGIVILGASLEWLGYTLQNVPTSYQIKFIPISGLTTAAGSSGELVEHFKFCLGSMANKSKWLVADVEGDTGNTMKLAIEVLQQSFPGIEFVPSHLRQGEGVCLGLGQARHDVPGVSTVEDWLLQSKIKEWNLRLFDKIEYNKVGSSKVRLCKSGVERCCVVAVFVVEEFYKDRFDEDADKFRKSLLQEFKEASENAAILALERLSSVSVDSDFDCTDDTGIRISTCSF